MSDVSGSIVHDDHQAFVFDIVPGSAASTADGVIGVESQRHLCFFQETEFVLRVNQLNLIWMRVTTDLVRCKEIDVLLIPTDSKRPAS